MRVLIAVSLLLPAVAWGQSFNADFDIFGGSPELGNGVPADVFGAAANQPGRWNRVNPSGGPKQLVGLDGVLTNVWLTRTAGNAQAGGWNNPINTGDYALLLNDAAVFGTSATWTLSGLQNREYVLYVYAVSPVPAYPPNPTSIFVPGSSSVNPQVVTGPMPGNSFQFLITHSIHEASVNQGELTFSVTSLDPNLVSAVNGFQLIAVPEPISAITLVAGLVVLALRKRRHAS